MIQKHQLSQLLMDLETFALDPLSIHYEIRQFLPNQRTFPGVVVFTGISESAIAPAVDERNQKGGGPPTFLQNYTFCDQSLYE